MFQAEETLVGTGSFGASGHVLTLGSRPSLWPKVLCCSFSVRVLNRWFCGVMLAVVLATDWPFFLLPVLCTWFPTLPSDSLGALKSFQQTYILLSPWSS